MSRSTQRTAVRQFRPDDPRLLGGLTLLDVVAKIAELALGGAGGFCLSYLLWAYVLPTQAIALLPAMALLAAIGVILVAKERARLAGIGWFMGMTLSALGAILALFVASSW